MPSHRERRELPYTPEQVFDLVADIEKYPEFLAWFVAVRVLHRTDNRADVEQIVRFEGLEARFVTHAVFDRPKSIVIDCRDPPFRRFEQRWTFAAKGADATALEYESTLELRSPLLQHVMAALFDEPQISRTMVDAFERRARQLYGRRAN